MNGEAELTTAQPDVAIASGAAEPAECGFTFTGSGKEYFRIWIVNLALTVATLGIYSAWAKVRRLQYFDRNTRLAGASFDFHGDPKAILKGRLLGVVLLALYHYSYGFSLAAGAAVVGLLLLALPFLLRSALRFRLSNTTYRGLSFGFSGSVAGAYLAYLPPMAAVLLPGALLAFDPAGTASAASALLYLGWPLMHAAMKRYQHAHLLYGDAASLYAVRARRFYGMYLRALLVALAGTVVLFGLAIAFDGMLHLNQVGSAISKVTAPLLGALAGYLVFLIAAAYVHVRAANLAWSNTAFRKVRIRSELSARAFMRLQAANICLTLLTLGLYRPFAVVRIYRYRLACASLLVEGGFEEMAGGAVQRAGAGGDAVAELLGFDLSW